jgi:hypothetical protein
MVRKRSDVRALLLQHLGYDVNLFALEKVAQLLAVQSCSSRATGRVLTDQCLAVGKLGEVQFVGVLEQRPAHAFKLGVELLLLSVSSALDAGATTWNLSKVTHASGRCSLTPLMKAGDMSMLTELTCSGEPPCSLRYAAKRSIVVAFLPVVTNTTRRACMSATSVRYS